MGGIKPLNIIVWAGKPLSDILQTGTMQQYRWIRTERYLYTIYDLICELFLLILQVENLAILTTKCIMDKLT